MRKVILAGSCDITAVSRYLVRSKNVSVIDYNSTGNWTCCLSTHWKQQLEHKTIPNPKDLNVFYPIINVQEADVLVLSILAEGIQGLYRNKENNCLICYPEDKNAQNKEQLKILESQYEYLGLQGGDLIAKNYKSIISKIRNQTKVIVILGPTFQSQFGEMNTFLKNIDAVNLYDQINKKVIYQLRNCTNVEFINPNQFYKKPKSIKDMLFVGYVSIAHYPKETYKKIAFQISKKSRFAIKYFFFRDQIMMIKRWLRRIIIK